MKTTRKSTLARSRRVTPPAPVGEGSSAAMPQLPPALEQYQVAQDVPAPLKQQIEKMGMEDSSDSNDSDSERMERDEEEEHPPPPLAP